VAFAGEAPKPRTPQDIINELMSDKAPERSPQELEAAYRVAIGELAKALVSEDLSKWANADRTLEALCHRAAAPGREAHRVGASKALIAQLKAKLSKPGLARIIRHIERIGGAEAVPALAGLLSNKDLREPARRALMRNPAPAAVEALRAALPKADKQFRIALIDALGARRDAGSVQPLIGQAGDADDDVRTHAVEALARIGDGSAASAIAAATKKGSPHARLRATDAYLALADSLAAKGEKDAALRIYRSLLRPKSYVTLAALLGIGKAGSAKDVGTIVASLVGDVAERGAARDALILLADKKATAVIAGRAKGAAPNDKALLIQVLGKRGDPSIVPVILAAAKDKEQAVRIAALQALGDLKAKQGVPTLVNALKTAKGAERDKAEWALSRVPGDEATQAIVAALKGADKEAKCVLVRSLAYRKDPGTLPTLIAATKDPEEEVGSAAFRAIAQLNEVKALPVILEALGTLPKGKVREAAAYALRRTHGKEATAAIVKAAKTAPPGALGPILYVLSWRDQPAVKEFFVASARSSNAEVKAAALDGLARVKVSNAVPLLIEAATKGTGAVRDAAVRTSLKYADDVAKADKAAAIAIFSLALDKKIVPYHNDRALALRALGKVGGPKVVDAICTAFRDRRLSGAAHDAVQRMAERLARGGDKDAAIEVYTKLARLSNDHGRIRRAQGELRKLGVKGDLAQRAGFITRWWVCGPFPNPRNALINKQLPPEREGVDLLKDVAAEGVTREWKQVHTRDPAGVVNLRNVVAKQNDVGALLYAEVTVPKAIDVLLKLGYEEGCVAASAWTASRRRPASKLASTRSCSRWLTSAGAGRCAPG